jgi:cyclohexanone monooxygenase
VTERFDLLRDIVFDTRVKAAVFDEATSRWQVETEGGGESAAVSAKYFVMATGCLSSANTPDFEGLGDFSGPCYHTGQWPHEGVDFSGRRVCVIGTGSSAVQSIPVIAEQATELHVFQRTPNYSIPARNGPLDPDKVRELKARYPDFRAQARGEGFGIVNPFPPPADQDPEYVPEAEELESMLERNWEYGGLTFLNSAPALVVLPELNELAAEFVRGKIRAVVDDPETAELLSPRTMVGCKRLCIDTNYFQTYNRPNVKLVDISDSPIEKITPKGVQVEGRVYECDDLVLATGFDAMTGALLGVDIRGREGLGLSDKWAAGPLTYLGLATRGFPNLFIVTGPGSPSVLSNMVQSIEQHVEWIADCMGYMEEKGLQSIEPSAEAEQQWVAQVNEIAAPTIFPNCNSWYVGANIPGKPRVFMPFLGFSDYVAICDEISEKDYEGFGFA